MSQQLKARLNLYTTRFKQIVRMLKLKSDSRILIKQGKFTCHFDSLRLYQKLYIYTLSGGRYEIGHNVQFGYDIGGRYRGGYCELQSREKDAVIKIGDYTAISNNFLAISRNRIEIGSHCRIGINCQIMDFEAHSTDPNNRSVPGEIGEVRIGNNVWIGNNVVVLKNVTIGENSIVAAGAVVCHDVPPNTIVGGVPAKRIKNI